FFFQAEDGIRDPLVTGVQTCALPIFESDGKDDIRAMAHAAKAAGLEYIAITDHSQSLAMANGLDERRALAHALRVRAVDAEGPEIGRASCRERVEGSRAERAVKRATR